MPTPPLSELVDASTVSTGEDMPARCVRPVSSGMLTRLVRRDESVGVYRCESAAKMPDGRPRFPLCRGLCPKMSVYELCIETRDGAIVGMSRYRWDRERDYVFLGTSGAHSEGACALTPPT